MSLQVLHCSKCGAVQPYQQRCGVCGAELHGQRDAHGELSAGDIFRLAAILFVVLAGIVVLGVLAMWTALSIL